MSPGDVLALRDSRVLLKTSTDLLRAVLAALGDAQTRLMGETPAARDLWDRLGTRGPKSYVPVREEELSDWLARHLRTSLEGRGMIINREVEVRRAWGEGTGARTDIHVQVSWPADDPNEAPTRMTLVVEVKGQWNGDVMTALRNQLVDQYLKLGKGIVGIYLVAWFSSPWWLKTTGTPRREPLDPIKTLDTLWAQARSELSDGFQVVPVVLDVGFPFRNERLDTVRIETPS